MSKLDDLLDDYWNIAYAEGREGRDHDTSDHRAGRTLSAIQAHYVELQKALALAAIPLEGMYIAGSHHMQSPECAAAIEEAVMAIRAAIQSCNAPPEPLAPDRVKITESQPGTD